MHSREVVKHSELKKDKTQSDMARLYSENKEDLAEIYQEKKDKGKQLSDL